MASEQLMVHSEETEAVVAEVLQIHAQVCMWKLALCLLTLHLALGNGLNLFVLYTPNSTTALEEKKKDTDQCLTVPITCDKMKIRINRMAWTHCSSAIMWNKICSAFQYLQHVGLLDEQSQLKHGEQSGFFSLCPTARLALLLLSMQLSRFQPQPCAQITGVIVWVVLG